MMIGHLLSEGGLSSLAETFMQQIVSAAVYIKGFVVYHKSCNINFRTFRDIRRQHRLAPESKRKKVGRPTNSDQEQSFYKMCTYFEENDKEQLTITDLSNKMKE